MVVELTVAPHVSWMVCFIAISLTSEPIALAATKWLVCTQRQIVSKTLDIGHTWTHCVFRREAVRGPAVLLRDLFQLSRAKPFLNLTLVDLAKS